MKTGLPARALRIVPYLTPEEIQQLCAACQGRHRDRDALLILLLFQTCLRISEALSLTVGHLSRQPGALEVVGKPRLVACPAALTHRLKAYAFDRGLGPGDRLFPIGRKRAWQIIGGPGRPQRFLGLKNRVTRETGPISLAHLTNPTARSTTLCSNAWK